MEEMDFILKHPLAGFENIKTMKLTQVDDFFYQLKSNDDDITFTLIDPFKLRDYEFEMPKYYSVLLDSNKKSKLLTLNIMIVTNPPEHSTINFIAPIVFNADNSTMIQVLLDTVKYPDFGITEGIDKFLSKM